MQWAENRVENEALLRMHLQHYGDVLVSSLVRRHRGFLGAHGLRPRNRPHWRIGHREVMQSAAIGLEVAAHAGFGKGVEQKVVLGAVHKGLEKAVET